MKVDRQRKELIPLWYRGRGIWIRRGLVAVAMMCLGLYPAALWGAIWPTPQYLETDDWAVRVAAQSVFAEIPPFRVAPRNRLNLQLEGEARLGERVRLFGAVGYLSDESVLGDRVSGPGDLRLGVTATAAEFSGFRAGFGWQVKVPSAADEAELGTDEMDVTLVTTIQRQVGDLRLMLVGGLSVMGDPLRFSSQDDAAVVGMAGVVPVGPVNLKSSVGGTVGTRRNPARMNAEMGLGYGCRWRVGMDGILGLTAAAPDYGARVWVGLGPRCD